MHQTPLSFSFYKSCINYNMDINKACLKFLKKKMKDKVRLISISHSTIELTLSNKMPGKYGSIQELDEFIFAVSIPLIQLSFFTVFTALNMKRNAN